MLQLNFLERLALGTMKQGHIPEHIAFIMDGNRRFAKTKHSQPLSGHQEGALTLKRCLLYCLQLGIKYASFYAFSIQNYKRAPEQVEFLMNLARSQFQKLSAIYEQDNIVDIVERNNVKVIIAGDLEGKLKAVYPDIREGLLKVQERTKNNTKMTMYLCFAYDSLYQYNRAIDLMQPIPQPGQSQKRQEEQEIRDVRSGRGQMLDNLMVPHYIDILIRTSGECRLSNYMLMQAGYGLIYIQKGFWPAFSIFSLSKVLLQYNYYFNDINCKKIKFAGHHTQ